MSRALATLFLAPSPAPHWEPFPHIPGSLLQRKPLLKGVGGDSNRSPAFHAWISPVSATLLPPPPPAQGQEPSSVSSRSRSTAMGTRTPSSPLHPHLPEREAEFHRGVSALGLTACLHWSQAGDHALSPFPLQHPLSDLALSGAQFGQGV